MTPELAYFLKVNVGIALLYTFYRLFFYKDTFFQWRRVTLLGIVIVSLLYPVPNLQEWIREQVSMSAVVDFYSAILLPEVTTDTAIPGQELNPKSILPAVLNLVYWGAAIMLFIHFTVQLAGIITLGIHTRTARINGVKVHILTNSQGPFSFFKWVFVHPSGHTETEIEEILTHELTHARQWHSIDVILSELLCIICWFNPCIWLLKREIRNNLEYLADHEVLENGYDYKVYQYHLLGLAHQKPGPALFNSFNMLPLKKRIRMMNKKRTKQAGRTKYLLFIPLVTLLLIISNIEVVARTTQKVIGEVLITEKAHTPATTEMAEAEQPNNPTEYKADPKQQHEDVVFEMVEEMPTFPNGDQALKRFLSQTIRYPARAQEEGTQGRITVQFVIDQNGAVTDPVLLRGISPELDAEALRVVSAMPAWIPGKQRGKDVRVRFTLPITFKLN